MTPTEGKDKNFKDRLVTLCTYHLFSQNLAVVTVFNFQHKINFLNTELTKSYIYLRGKS